MLNVAAKCVVLGEAMQSFVYRQHDAYGVGKIKYRKELSSRYATFVYLYVNATCRDVVIANQVGFLSRR